MAELAPPEDLVVTTTHNGPLGRGIEHMEYHELRQPDAGEPGDPFVLVAIDHNGQRTTFEALGLFSHPRAGEEPADRAQMVPVGRQQSYKAESAPVRDPERRLTIARYMAHALFGFANLDS